MCHIPQFPPDTYPSPELKMKQRLHKAVGERNGEAIHPSDTLMNNDFLSRILCVFTQNYWNQCLLRAAPNTRLFECVNVARKKRLIARVKKTVNLELIRDEVIVGGLQPVNEVHQQKL